MPIQKGSTLYPGDWIGVRFGYYYWSAINLSSPVTPEVSFFGLDIGFEFVWAEDKQKWVSIRRCSKGKRIHNCSEEKQYFINFPNPNIR